MNNVKTREEILILRQNELLARNNYNAALTEYIEALNISTNSKTISCGDDRFLIIQKVLKGFEVNTNLVFPEEVDRQGFEEDADEYQYLINIVANVEKIKTKVSNKKVSLGVKLADDFQTIHNHVTLKSAKNDKYIDVSKDTAVYHDPKGKRKESQLAKKRTERAAKKQSPTA